MKKKLIPFLFIFTIVFSFMSIPTYAASQTYKSTLLFDSSLTGATRQYKYNNISYSATTRCYIGRTEVTPNSSLPPVYTVSLYRKSGLFKKEKVGSKTISRYGYNKVKWTNVGKGKYYFYFKKPIDGVRIESNNVTMKSYS